MNFFKLNAYERNVVIQGLSFFINEVTCKPMRIYLGAAGYTKYYNNENLGITPTYSECIISNGNFMRSNSQASKILSASYK